MDKSKVYSILTVYDINQEELEFSVNNLLELGCFVVICNNSNYNLNIYNERAKIFNFNKNLGIAEAQSIGMQWAYNEGALFFLQMDQDSVPSPDMLDELMYCYNALNKDIKVGLVVAQDFDKDTKKITEAKIDKGEVIPNTNFYIINQAISSSSLISREAYKTIGGMDDTLFIDSVDFEYCWRLIDSGFLIVKNSKAMIAHKLGDGSKSCCGLFDIGIPSPIRHYYQYRNILLLTRRSYIPMFWKIRNLAKLFLKLFLVPIFLDKKKERLSFIISGINDGLMNKSGSYKK